jgi:hypothetical protein
VRPAAPTGRRFYRFRGGTGDRHEATHDGESDRLRRPRHFRGYLPEWITFDGWDYPVIKPGNLPPAQVEHARRAADACPTIAIILRRVESP